MALKKAIVLLLIISVIVTCANTCDLSGIQPGTGVTVKVEKEWKGHNSGFNEPARLVIKTEGQWREVWEKVNQPRHPKPELPEIDFEKEMIIAVFMGTRSSGGYEIEIKSITKTEEEIIVEVKEKEPPPGAFLTMALTQPYHIVVVKMFPLRVSFHTHK